MTLEAAPALSVEGAAQRPIIDKGWRMFDQCEERCSREACGAFKERSIAFPVAEPVDRNWSESSGDRADENESARPPCQSLNRSAFYMAAANLGCACPPMRKSP